MKKLLVLFILITFLLSSCGSFSLDGWLTPDDLEFIAVVESLDTPEKIGDYMLENFTYELHIFNILSPYQLYITQKGDCDDFANFSMFISNYHGYETFLVKICYKNYAINHYLAIYKENNLYNFSVNQYYTFVNYDNFSDIVKFDSQWMYDFYGYIWSKYIVYDYDNNVIEKGFNN